jgi:uncharacterized protein (DUF342 family)
MKRSTIVVERMTTMAKLASAIIVAAAIGAGTAAAQTKPDLKVGGSGSGCSLTNITSKGCPPKIVQQLTNLKKEGADAEKEMDQASADILKLDPKDPNIRTKTNELMAKWSNAAATVERIKTTLGPDAPKDAIDYRTKLETKKQDMGKKLEDYARSKIGCVPHLTRSSISCEFKTNALGGRK